MSDLDDFLSGATSPAPSDPALPIENALGGNPDQAAREQALSARTGLPPEAVAADPAFIEQELRRTEIDNFLNTAPATRRFMSDPANATVAVDDVETLSLLERAWPKVRGVAKSIPENVVRVPGMTLDGLGELYGTVDRAIQRPLIQALTAAGAPQGVLDFLTAPVVPDYLSPGQILEQPGEVLLGAADDLAPTEEERSFASDVTGGLTQLGAQVAQLWATGGMSAWPAIAQLLAQGASQVSEDLEQNFPAVENTPAGDAATVLGAGVTAVTERIGLDLLFNRIPATMQPRLVRMILGGVSEGTQETAESVLQNAVAIALYDPDRELVGEGDLYEGQVAGTVGLITQMILPGRQAIQNRQQMDAAREVVQQSKLQQRDPAKAAVHHAEVLKDAGIEEVYVPVEQFDAALATAGLDPDTVYREMGVAQQINEARTLGTDVRLNGQQFARYVLSADYYDQIADHVRFDEGGMTAAEAVQFAETGVQDQLDALGLTPDQLFAAAAMEPEVAQAAEAEVAPTAEAEVAGAAEAGIAASAQAEAAPAAEGEVAVAADAEISRDSTPISPETEEEVSFAERELGLQGLFRSADEAGMTPSQYQEYLVSLQRAAEAGRVRQEKKRLKREQRELTQEWQELRERERETVRESLTNDPVYQAVLGIGKDRLDRKMLAALLPNGEAQLQEIPKALGRTIYTAKGEKGIDPNTYAQLHGFTAADEMIFAYMDLGDFDARVEAEVDRVMVRKYAELRDRSTAIREAMDSLHNDNYAAVLAFEFNQLRGAQREGRLKPALVRQVARERLARQKVGELRPERYMAAAKRAGRQAGLLLRRGDREGAAKAKAQQAMNFEFAMQAIKKREQIKSQQKYLRKFMRQRKKWRTLPQHYLDTIRTLLSDYEIGPRLSDANRKNLEDWVRRQADDGVAVEIPQRLRDAAFRKNYQDMTLEQWEELHDTVKALYHKGVTENKLMREAEKATRDEIVATIVQNVNTNLRQRKVSVNPGGFLSRANDRTRQYVALHLNMDTLTRDVDGGKQGETYRNLKGRYDQAYYYGYHEGQVGYVTRQHQEALAVNELFERFDKRQKVSIYDANRTIPGVREKLSHNTMLAVLLNTGNKENYQALIDGKQFTPDEITAIQAAATKQDWDFVQAVWDYFETFWPEIEQATMRRTNSRPERVQAEAVQTAHGVYRGGYYPLRYDNRGGGEKAAWWENPQEAIEKMRMGHFVSSQTARGHTKERVGSGGRRLKLDLGVINQHVDQVIYDLEVGDALTDVYKLLYDKRTKQAFYDRGHGDKWEAMDLWFGDVVTNEIRKSDFASTIMRSLRTGWTVNKLAWNVGTTAVQIFGISQTAAQIGSQATWQGLRIMAASPQFGRNSIYAEVSRESPLMAQRQEQFHKDIIDASRQLSNSLMSRALPGKSADVLIDSFFYAMKKVQFFVDTWTWVAAKAQGMKKFDGDEAQAREYADRMVPRSQASGNFGERSALERGTISRNERQSEMYRSFTALASYFIAKNNIAYEKTKNLRRDLQDPNRTRSQNIGDVIRWSADMTLLFLVDAIAVAVLRGQFPTGEDEEEPGWLQFAGEQMFGTLMGGIVGAREFWSEAQGFRGGGVFSVFLQDWQKTTEQLGQGEIDAALLKNVNNLLGTIFRYPATQINKTAETAYLYSEGEDMEWREWLFGPNIDK